MTQSHLFKPLKIGNVEVKHRIGLAPLTRLRATDSRLPTPMMKEYYGQRAAVPGTLIISEGTFVSSTCGGFPNGPGIWSEEQIVAWKTITDEVHAKGSFIFCQLFAMGRAAEADLAKKEGFSIVGPSAIAFDAVSAIPCEMTIGQIKETVQEFVDASKNAIRAGFDGVEIHGANGYLLDQFIQDMSNTRTDEYGGSVENRSRLYVEVVKAVLDVIGPERVGLRLSPWSIFQGMKMKDPIPQFSDIITKTNHLGLAYLSLIESRVSGGSDVVSKEVFEGLDFAYDLWDGPFLIAGAYKPDEAQKLVDEKYPDKKIVVLFGRWFISNPDLVFKIKEGLELTKYDRSTFYGKELATGYIDYPFGEEYLATRQGSKI